MSIVKDCTHVCVAKTLRAVMATFDPFFRAYHGEEIEGESLAAMLVK